MNISPVRLISPIVKNNFKLTKNNNISFNADYDTFTKSNSENEKIKKLFSQFDEAYLALENNAKEEFKALNTILKIGAKESYRGYVPYTDDEKLLFSDFDEQGIPKKATVISVSQGLKPIKEYDFESGSPLFTVTNYDNPQETVVNVLNKKPLSVFDRDKETGLFSRFVFSKDETIYHFGICDNDGNVSSLKVIANYSSNPKECYYLSKNDDENYNLYQQNEKTSDFELKGIIKGSDIAQFM